MNKPDESTIPVLTEIIELAPEIERAAAGPLADLDLTVGAPAPRAFAPTPSAPAPATPPKPAPPPIRPVAPPASNQAADFQAPLAPPQFSTETFLAASAAPQVIEKIVERVVEKVVEVEKIVEVQKIVEVEKLVDRIVEVEKVVEKIVEVEKPVIQTKLVEVPPTDTQLEEMERRVREHVLSGIGPRVEQLLQEHLRSRLDSILHFTLASLEQELREAIDASLREAISDSVHEHVSQQKLNLKTPRE